MPFVDFLMQPTKGINSTPILIFGKDEQRTCILESLVLANQTDNQILVSVYLLREEGEPTTIAVEYPLVTNKPLPAFESIDWLQGKSLTMSQGDLLFAYSDSIDSYFSTFVSYKELNELPLQKK